MMLIKYIMFGINKKVNVYGGVGFEDILLQFYCVNLGNRNLLWCEEGFKF